MLGSLSSVELEVVVLSDDSWTNGAVVSLNVDILSGVSEFSNIGGLVVVNGGNIVDSIVGVDSVGLEVAVEVLVIRDVLGLVTGVLVGWESSKSSKLVGAGEEGGGGAEVGNKSGRFHIFILSS